MALKALESAHLLSAYSPTLEFRVPPLITVIPDHMLYGCRATFSLELPETVIEIENYAFSNCYCLRNVAFPPNAVIDYNIFIEEEDHGSSATVW